MNKKGPFRHKILSGLLILLTLTVVSTSTLAFASPVNVQSRSAILEFDGQRLAVPKDQYIFMINGTNYVPIRFLSYALNKHVAWDAKTKTVIVKEPTELEKVQLKEYLVNLVIRDDQPSATGGSPLSVTPMQARFVFENEPKALPDGQSVYNLNGWIYVPIRFMSESIGIEIRWDGKTGTISAETPAYQDAQKQEGKPAGDNPKGEATPPVPAAPSQPAAPPAVPAPSGGGGGGAVSKPSKESIESAAEQQLQVLRDQCVSSLTGLGLQYLGESDEQKKNDLIAQGQAKLAECTSQFNQIVSQTESQLTANGYSTEILQYFRDTFERELATGRELLEGLLP